jgi:hypothetical protein
VIIRSLHLALYRAFISDSYKLLLSFNKSKFIVILGLGDFEGELEPYIVNLIVPCFVSVVCVSLCLLVTNYDLDLCIFGRISF